MKDFNLKDALAGKPVITRDGRPVKIAGYNPDVIESQRIAAWIGDFICDYGENGKRYSYTNYDLFMAPTERKEWVVRVSDTCVLGIYKTSADAYDAIMRVGMPATIHEITIHE